MSMQFLNQLSAMKKRIEILEKKVDQFIDEKHAAQTAEVSGIDAWAKNNLVPVYKGKDTEVTRAR